MAYSRGSALHPVVEGIAAVREWLARDDIIVGVGAGVHARAAETP